MSRTNFAFSTRSGYFKYPRFGPVARLPKTFLNHAPSTAALTPGPLYSLRNCPFPTGGTSNQKWKGAQSGGGQGGWGNGLILAEDQKEYIRAMSNQRRTKQKDLMDEDNLPSIFTGDRAQSGGRVRVGAGRSVNARKR